MKSTLIISDLHLGSKVCKADKIVWVLTNVNYDNLVINGDLFDAHHIHRFKKDHWKILSILRKLTKTKNVVLVEGNHETKSTLFLSRILGLKVKKMHIFKSKGKKIACIHGHQFDSFLKEFPIFTHIFTGLYYLVQLIDTKNQRISSFFKKISKTLLKVPKKQRDRAIRLAQELEIDVIISGHSHLPEHYKDTWVQSINSGSFCENPCHYVLVDDKGQVTLNEI